MKKLVKDRLFNSVAIAALVVMVCVILIEGFWPSMAHANQGFQVTGGAQGSADLGDGWPVHIPSTNIHGIMVVDGPNLVAPLIVNR